MLIALQEHKVRQHLVPHSRSVWSHEETTVTEHTFHWCWGSRCAEDPPEEAVQHGELRLMLHSFPGVWVSRETAGLLTNKSEVVPHDCWYRNMAGNAPTFSSVTPLFVWSKQWRLGTFAWWWLIVCRQAWRHRINWIVFFSSGQDCWHCISCDVLCLKNPDTLGCDSTDDAKAHKHK